ncbi:Double zinc ribbon and ankyrin repeat-containing protein 1 [Nymphon striatum]|nr:Double zinc ribbon and ankyrin repeat-containing protein 1 [Nymphon striatum]
MTNSSLPAPFIIPIRDPFCGKPKRLIDTNTPIELQTETVDTTVYYTLDGSKPNPYKISTVSLHGVTCKYQRPFRLEPGKQMIKAVTVNQHHESSIVTKVFHVEWVKPPILETSMSNTSRHKNLIRRQSEGNFNTYNNEELFSSPKVKFNKPRPKSALALSHPSTENEICEKDTSERCPYCYTLKAPDSYVSFCYRCGAKLIVFNKNPHFKVGKPGLSNGKVQVSSQMLSNAIGDVWMDGKEWDMAIKDNTCGSCGRNNCRDSRYCDSCGSRLNIQCMVCSSEQNPINAKFCLQCGTALMDGINLLSEIKYEEPPPPKPEMKTQSTQTFGIFYPSSKEMLAKSKDLKFNERKLSHCSPGNGYWRQQIDHISTHLKAYAYNNLDFRNLIREPRIGTLLYARLRELESGCINILMSFTLERNKQNLNSQKILSILRNMCLLFNQFQKLLQNPYIPLNDYHCFVQEYGRTQVDKILVDTIIAKVDMLSIWNSSELAQNFLVKDEKFLYQASLLQEIEMNFLYNHLKHWLDRSDTEEAIHKAIVHYFESTQSVEAVILLVRKNAGNNEKLKKIQEAVFKCCDDNLNRINSDFKTTFLEKIWKLPLELLVDVSAQSKNFFNIYSRCLMDEALMFRPNYANFESLWIRNDNTNPTFEDLCNHLRKLINFASDDISLKTQQLILKARSEENSLIFDDIILEMKKI